MEVGEMEKGQRKQRHSGLVCRNGKWGWDFVHSRQRHIRTIGEKQAAIEALRGYRGRLLDARLSEEFGIKRGRGAGVTLGEFFTSTYTPWHEANRSAQNSGWRYLLGKFCAEHGKRP